MEAKRSSKSGGKSGIFVILAAMAVVLVGTEVGYCRTITVRADGSGDYATIQAAIDDANEGNEVVLEPGTYTGNRNRDIDFLGKAITVRSTDPEDATVVTATVVDCNGSHSEPHRGFKFMSSEGADSVLSGITIMSGFALEEQIDVAGLPSEAYIGGGIFCDGSSPTIVRCVIKGNTAEWGGGMSCVDSNATISDCVIEENAVNYSGGGIQCFGGNPTISGCTVGGNLGAGIACGRGMIRNCVIEDNVGYMGVGINCGSATISNCAIRSNTAGGWGGGVYCGDATITDCTISDNSAEGEYGRGGGIYCAYGSSPVITGCIISGNRGTEEGGGIGSNWQGTKAVISNCVITGNIAKSGDGGGLAYCNGPITNCTIAGNRAGGAGGEGGRGGGVDGFDYIGNCIIRGNWPDQIYGSGSVTYSDVEGGWAGEGNIDVEPGFALEGDYHIMPDSACIDTGTNDPCGGLAGTDLEGVARPLDGDGDGNAVSDMGAYEFDPNRPRIAVSARSFYFVQDWPGHETQTLLIRNSGGAPLNWEVVEDCNWLEVVRGSGMSRGDIHELMLIVDANGLAPWVYSYTVILQDANDPEVQVSIEVTLPVGCVLQVPSAEYPTIQAAIDVASDYDVVVIGDGNYTGDGNKNLDFGGKAIRVKSENGPANCVIDCEGSGRGFYFNNGEEEGSVVDGFTIAKSGYGVWCRDGSPTIRKCSVIDNSGGGIVCWGPSNPLVTGCVLSDNGEGGIIYDPRGGHNTVYAVISSCRIVNNKGSGIGSGRGGMLTITDCTLSGNDGPGISCGRATIENCTIEGNTRRGVNCTGELKMDGCIVRGNVAGASSWAAGIYCGGDAEFTNCVISDNAAQLVAGVFCGGQDTKIESCIISGNLATEFNGGICCYVYGPGSLTISGCTIRGNRANEMSGARLVGYENVEVRNCLIAGNSAEVGVGGIVVSGSDNVVVSNCTVSDNETKSVGEYGTGGGVSFYGGNVSVDSCIMWGNKGPEGPQMYLGSNSNVLVSYSDVEGGEVDVYVEADANINWGEGNIDLEPSFVEMGYWDVNGTPNDVNDDLWVEGDYHLLEGSPCIDAGDPNHVAGPNETDLDGSPRVADGDDDGNSVVDMGAYEFTVFNTAPVACIVGGEQTVEAGVGCEGKVVLDGSCSSDADSTEGTNDDINDFDWYEVVDACEPNSDIYLGSGEVIECNLGLGEHVIVLEVTDKAGAFDSNEVVITVEDVTPPELSVAVEPNILWPPNGKMVLVRPEWEVSDNCDEEVEVSLVDISMNVEGDINDYVRIGDDGSIYLRAVKTERGGGRIYTLTYEAVDDSGNTAQASATVTVPHSRKVWRLGRGLVRRPGKQVYRKAMQRRGEKK